MNISKPNTPEHNLGRHMTDAGLELPCDRCGALVGKPCSRTCPNLQILDETNAPEQLPPAGDVPAARPVGEPGEAAVFVDWAAIGREFEAFCARTDRAEWFQVFILDKHTRHVRAGDWTAHPVPVGLAAKMRAHLEALSDGAVYCDAPFDVPCMPGCFWEVNKTLSGATPTVVAALDQAPEDNSRLREALGRALSALEAAGNHFDHDNAAEAQGQVARWFELFSEDARALIVGTP